MCPGISRTFAPGGENLGDDEWRNSGYGLYMVSRLCEELGGSFIIASGDSAIRLNNKKNIKNYRCHLQGTGIQIRIRPSKIINYERIAEDILKEGEMGVKDSKNAYKAASKATKSLFGYDD